MRPIIIKLFWMFCLSTAVAHAQHWQSRAEAESAIQQIKDDTVILDRLYAESQKKCQESFFVYACLEKERQKYEQMKRANTLLQADAEQYIQQIKADERLERIASREAEYQQKLQQPVAPRQPSPSNAPSILEQQENRVQFEEKQEEAKNYAAQQAQRSAEAERKRLERIADRERRLQRYQEALQRETTSQP